MASNLRATAPPDDEYRRRRHDFLARLRAMSWPGTTDIMDAFDSVLRESDDRCKLTEMLPDEPPTATQGPTREELACALRYVLSYWHSITHMELPNGSPLVMTFPRADDVLARYDAQVEPPA